MELDVVGYVWEVGESVYVFGEVVWDGDVFCFFVGFGYDED